MRRDRGAPRTAWHCGSLFSGILQDSTVWALLQFIMASDLSLGQGCKSKSDPCVGSCVSWEVSL